MTTSIFENFTAAKSAIENFTDVSDKFAFDSKLQKTLDFYGDCKGMFGFLNWNIEELKDLVSKKQKELIEKWAIEQDKINAEASEASKPNPKKLENMVKFANQWLDGEMVCTKENYQKAKKYMNEHHLYIRDSKEDTANLLHSAFCGIIEFYNFNK